jgi:hypothetical protein
VEFYGGTTTTKRLKGWAMKMAVPVLFDPTAGGVLGLVEEGNFYIPGPADPPANYNARKRGRYED